MWPKYVRNMDGGTVFVGKDEIKYGWRREGEYPNTVISAAIEGLVIGRTESGNPITTTIPDENVYRKAEQLIAARIGPEVPIIKRDLL